MIPGEFRKMFTPASLCNTDITTPYIINIIEFGLGQKENRTLNSLWNPPPTITNNFLEGLRHSRRLRICTKGPIKFRNFALRFYFAKLNTNFCLDGLTHLRSNLRPPRSHWRSDNLSLCLTSDHICVWCLELPKFAHAECRANVIAGACTFNLPGEAQGKMWQPGRQAV